MIFYETKCDKPQKVTSTTYVNLRALLHFHRSIELVFVRSGKFKIRIGRKHIIVGKDEIAFIPEYFAHDLNCMEKGSATNFIIPYEYYKPFIDRKILLNYSLLDNKEINDKIWQIIAHAQPVLPSASEMLVKGYVEVILGLITDSYPPEDIEKSDNAFVIEVINYIEKNIKSVITLDSIAKEFNYSKYYFSKLFNRSFGCNLNHYTNQVRYNNVLNNYEKGKNITEVIMASGFNDLSTFYKFKSSIKKK